MFQRTVLVVEDEPDIVELLLYNLEKADYNVKVVMSGDEALKYIRSTKPDAILLDLMIPGIDGLKLCHILKTDLQTKDLPILIVSARGEENDVVRGLELGADDYVTKPFSPKILLARLEAVLRRRKTTNLTESILNIEKLKINVQKHEVLLEEETLDLTPTEFKLLQFLAMNRGFVFTRDQIVDGIKGEDYPVTDRSVDVQVVGLRKKLAEYGDYIETVRGIGYRFK